MTRREKLDQHVRDALAAVLHDDEDVRGTFLGWSRVRLALILPPLCAWVLWFSVQGRDLEVAFLGGGTALGVYLRSRALLFAVTSRRVFVLPSTRGWAKQARMAYDLTNGASDLTFRRQLIRTFVTLVLEGREVTVELGPRELKRARAVLDKTPERRAEPAPAAG